MPTEPASALGLAGGVFVAPKDPIRLPGSAAELTEPDYTPPPAEPIEWDTEKAAMIASGFGGILHSLDPLADTPYGAELWRMTEADAKAIGTPLARILNRYATARELAGYSDEVGLGMAAWPYFKSNLQTRGRARMLTKRDQRQGPHAAAYTPDPTPGLSATPPPEPVPAAPAHLADAVIDGAPLHHGDDLSMFQPLVVDPLQPVPETPPAE